VPRPTSGKAQAEHRARDVAVRWHNQCAKEVRKTRRRCGQSHCDDCLKCQWCHLETTTAEVARHV
jgi:hypothetical protein